ncbi:metallophosphoesterase [Tannerella sp.]|uniref:metallophosphoesterase family protein n=1 Tax=Tannerella sp. TaxID=2382127 RepID=UPI0026DB3DA9|nr:metallophosphoesterase family protein [Tannerella sp.]MDO4704438.1 metallophosphoesterase family protein [Tannerella sp.]
MQTIGLLSDTHGWWDEKYASYFASCDEIWHAGDIGSADVALRLSAIRPLRAVCGNIDGYPVRQMYPKTLHFTVEDVSVMMTHIGGYPGRYEPTIRAELYETKPRLFVCGHSHILKVMFDKRLNCLCLNPGAAGKSGFHTVRTLMRFVIDGADIRDMEIIELAKR